MIVDRIFAERTGVNTIAKTVVQTAVVDGKHVARYTIRWLLGLTAVLAIGCSTAMASEPTANELAMARGVAVSYWHGNPPCGRPAISVGADPSDWLSATYFETCSIVLSQKVDWKNSPEKLCKVMAHEYGHLVVGPTAYEAENPTNPSESLNTENIMFSAPENVHFPQCEPLHGHYEIYAIATAHPSINTLTVSK